MKKRNSINESLAYNRLQKLSTLFIFPDNTFVGNNIKVLIHATYLHDIDNNYYIYNQQLEIHTYFVPILAAKGKDCT